MSLASSTPADFKTARQSNAQIFAFMKRFIMWHNIADLALLSIMPMAEPKATMSNQ